VALSLALFHPETVSALILASGYYYATPRSDAAAMSGPAFPILGEIVRCSVSPLLARALWPLVKRKIFGPAQVPSKFYGFPKEMTFRPSQIRASAAESALMIADALARSKHYSELKMPVEIIAGEDDQMINN